MALALSMDMIDRVILTRQEKNLQAVGVMVNDPERVIEHAGSKFVAAPVLAEFNRLTANTADPKNLHTRVVVTPCQALAIAKMKVLAPPEDRERISGLKLVVGLFCGWTFNWRELQQLTTDHVGPGMASGLDIPPSKYRRMEVFTDQGSVNIPIDEAKTAVRESCRYCFDMTAEFSDISVGSARTAEGWKKDRGWNIVIVRSKAGKVLLDLARTEGMLEFKDLPTHYSNKLKRAAISRKQTCLTNLASGSGNPDDIDYLDTQDPVVQTWF
jgi:coenzyme F420 hydrogenase subunit beta